MNPALIKSLGQRYGIPIAAVGAATVARMLLNAVLGDRLPFATFFLAIVFAAWYGGFGPALLSTLLSGLAADFIFLKPRGSFQIEDAPDQISLGLYFLVGLSCAWLGGSLHAARRRLEASEAKLRRMNETLAQHVAERTAELAESEERFRALYEQAAIGIEMLDFDGRLQKGNDKLCQILGFSQAELRQRDISELTHPEDLVHQQPLLQRLLAGEIPSFSIEKRYLHREGHPVWVRVTSSIIRTSQPYRIALVEDITERKRAEEALVQAQQQAERHLAQLETVLEYISEGLVVSDLEGQLIHWNKAALQIHGYARLEEGQRRLAELANTFELSNLDGTILPLEQWPMARVLRGEVLRHWEVRVRRQGTDWRRVFLYSGALVRDVQGQPYIAVLSVADVTDRRQAEEALRQANLQLWQQVDQLAQANRELKMKNQENEAFVYSVSHDLRSPLVNLQGFSQELGRSSQDLRTLFQNPDVPTSIQERGLKVVDGTLTRSIHFIQTAVTRLGSIIDALLRLSRAGRVVYRRQTVDVQALVARVVDSLRVTADQRQAIIQVHDLPSALGDPAALEQVFANIINNSLNYLDSRRRAASRWGA